MKNQDIIGALGSGVTGYISTVFYETWVQPIIISAVCAVIGLLITHYGRRFLNSLDNRRLFPKFKQNGKK